MNFVSKFDGSLPFTGTHPKAQTHVESVTTKAPADAIIVKDAQLLFTGDFKRSGSDLIISKGDQELRLEDYFKGDKHAPLASPDGAFLTGHLVDALTGHVQVAQADGNASVVKVIGHVTKLTGNATVIRNGVSIILNDGDNVHQGDVVQTGSNSTLGITFVDGSVFGLASNAKMVLSEMVYDPNGSNNSSLMSLVAGTISFVAGATAKHGDMKVDTPVATMGIRGTACLVEIEFDLSLQPVQPNALGVLAPPVKFQVLVEPDGTTGSYVLLDRITLAPIANINQAGTVTTVSGQGTVSFLASAQLSPEVMKLITEVFSQKFTDNSNPRSDTHFTDTVIPDNSFPVRFANGDTGTATVRVFSASEGPQGSNTPAPKAGDHIPGAPGIFTVNKAFAEFIGLTGKPDPNGVQGTVGYTDLNPGDQPTVSTAFNHYGYKNATGQDVTSSLTTTQKIAIDAVSVPLHVAQDPDLKNNGAATWTYSVPDQNLDFLADGEKLTLTYVARVDNNFAGANEFSLAPFTITITGKNDTPTIASAPQIASIKEIDDPDSHDSATPDTATGKIEFKDVDLTDTHSVAITGVTGSGTMTGLQGAGGTSATSTIPISDTSVLHWLSLSAPFDSTDGVTGSRIWTFSAQDHYFDYLAETESVTLTYTVEVDDHHGGTVTQNVVVTVNGSNDAPELAADVSGELDAYDQPTGLHSIQEKQDATNSADTDSAGGSLAFRDLDLSDTHTVSASIPVFNWTNSYGQTLSPTLVNALTGASHLSLTLHDSTGTGDGSVDFSYSATDHYFDFLAEGETLTITYDVTVADHYTSDTQSVTVTVTGTNDKPVAAADVVDVGTIVEAGVDAYNNLVAGNPDTSGNVLDNDTDVDLTDTHAVIGVVAGTSTTDVSGHVGDTIVGTYGDLVLNENGTWTYHLRNDYAATDALAQGAHAQDVFTYTEWDHHTGGTATATLTINITGTNDTPVANAEPVAVNDVGDPVSERGVHPGNDPFDGVAIVSGNVLTNDTDVDTGDTKAVQSIAIGTTSSAVTDSAATEISGVYGTLSIAADGSWTYTLDNNRVATQALTQGQHETEVFTYTMHDTLGSPASATLTIDVYGTNDAPTLADVHTGTPTDTAVNDSFDNLTGTLVGTDLDSGETTTLSYAALDGATAVNTAVTGLYGKLTVNTDGSYVYVPNAAVINALHSGPYTDTFTVQTTDVNGAIGTATFTVDVTGANDAPTLADVHTGTPTDTAVNDSFSNLTGTLVGTDLDSGETATLSYAALDGATAVNTAVTGLYGKLTVSTDGSYVYVPNAAVINALHSGPYTDSFTVQTIDVNGAIGTATFTVDVTGANDTPTLAAVHTGTPTDTAANDSFTNLTGVLVGTDRDSGETASLSYAALDGATAVNAAVTGLYGKLTVNTNGSYVYVPNAAVINALHAGSYTDTFTVQTTDVNGAIGTATFAVDVTGANDTPTLAVVHTGTLTDTAANDSFSNLTGTLVGTDLDSGETATLSYAAFNGATGVNTAVTGLYGKLTVSTDGSYVYVPNAAAINALNVGSFVDTFTVQTTDAHGAIGTATFKVDVTGADDPTVITGTSTKTLTETDAAQSTGGTLTATDPDSSNLFTVQTNVAGDHGYGHFSINAAGVWTYTMDTAHNEFVAGTDYTDSITVATADGTTQPISVTIHGTNDAAVIAGTITGVVEIADDGPGSGTATATGTLTDTDIDNAPNTFIAVAAGSASDNHYGTFQMTAAGVWTYTLDNSNPTVHSLADGHHLTDTFTLHTVDGTAQAITITITDNDDPDHDTYAADGLTVLARTNQFVQGGNNHNLVGNSANNTIIGNNDSSVDQIKGEGGDDTIYGRHGNDVLLGGSGNDTIYGGSGSDTITGGADADQLWGGSGADTFVFTSIADSTPSSFDTIHDFQAGVDHIDVHGLGFSAGTSGLGAMQAFSLNWSQVGADTVIVGDTNGNSANAEFKIVLSNVSATSLHLSDFHLS